MKNISILIVLLLLGNSSWAMNDSDKQSCLIAHPEIIQLTTEFNQIKDAYFSPLAAGLFREKAKALDNEDTSCDEAVAIISKISDQAKAIKKIIEDGAVH